MSHQLIQTALAATFIAVWALIGWTTLGEGLSEVRRRRSAPGDPHRGPHYGRRRPREQQEKRSRPTASGN